MSFMTVVVAACFSLLSTAIMSYISMAVSIGPWIAPTLALCALWLFSLLYSARAKVHEAVVFTTIAGSVGGIVATAYGFSLPTLFFLDPDLFAILMAHPLLFCGVTAILVVLAGALAFALADLYQSHNSTQERLPFPVSQLVHKIIEAHESVQRVYELGIGFVSTVFFVLLQNGFFFFRDLVITSIPLSRPIMIGCMQVPAVSFPLWPMVWAMGFVTGYATLLPLVIGSLAKLLLLNPVHQVFFRSLSVAEFILAFCSGIVLAGIIKELLTIRVDYVRCLLLYNSTAFMDCVRSYARNIRLMMVALAVILFFRCFALPWYVALSVVFLSCVCVHQVMGIIGAIGIVPLGRLATLVMLPVMMFFNVNYAGLVLITAFVEIVCGVAADVASGQKLSFMSRLPVHKAQQYQWLGLVVSAVTMGVIFWLLITKFGLGTVELCAQKAHNRQLLIQMSSFNYVVLLLGFLFGMFLNVMRMGSSLILGGIVMPYELTLGLIVGGLLSRITTNPQRWYPFWSGVFTAHSLLMSLRALCC